MDRIDSSSMIELNRRLADMLRQCQAEREADKAAWAAEKAAMRTEIATLKEANSRQDHLLVEMGEQLADQAETKWHMNMEKVSTKRISPPAKKVMSIFYDLSKDTPQTVHGDRKFTEKQVMQLSGYSKSTVKRALEEIETKQLAFIREESGQGTQRYFKVDTQIMRNPFAIHRIVPVDKPENRGGEREKPVCFNCGSTTRVHGHRHDMLKCEACGQSWDERSDIGEIEQPAIDEADTAEMPTVKMPIVKPHFSMPITPLPATVAPPGPDELCANCHRPRRVCWYPSHVAAGQWSASCQNHLVRSGA